MTFQESGIARKLAILNAIYQSSPPPSLEEIARSAGYRVAPTERALRQLIEQGIVRQEGDNYDIPLVWVSDVGTVLSTIKPWLHAKTESFYEIARDAAQIILTKSWAEARVEDVLLYGSTLQSKTPRDIDLVVFHSGGQLAEFEPTEYAQETKPGSQPIHDLTPDDPQTTRLDAYNTLSRLGYRKSLADNVVRLIGDRIAALDAGSPVSEEDIALVLRVWRNELTESTLGAVRDIHGIASVFDIHVMHTGLLGWKLPEDRAEKMKARGYNEQQIRQEIAHGMQHYAQLRNTAIQSCRDPTFWHSVFSEGKLYDKRAHDFSLGIEEKYPGALKLFETESR